MSRQVPRCPDPSTLQQGQAVPDGCRDYEGYLWHNGRRLDNQWKDTLFHRLQYLFQTTLQSNDENSPEAQSWAHVSSELLDGVGSRADLAQDLEESIDVIGKPLIFLNYVVHNLITNASDNALLEVEEYLDEQNAIERASQASKTKRRGF